MNDGELRSRFDVMVDRVPANAQAESLVRARAGRLRRRRSTAVAVGLAVVVVAAVAVPESLQHQAKSHVALPSGPSASMNAPAPASAPSPGPSATAELTDTCTPALTKSAGAYGEIQHFYGLRTSGPVAAAFLISLSGATGPVDFCLVVGDLDKLTPSLPPGVPDRMHYAVLADEGAGPRLVSAGANLPSPALPGIDPAAIAAFQPSPAASLPVVPTLGASAAVEVPPCTSRTVSGMLRGVAVVDGGPQGEIDLSTTSALGCDLRGSLHLAALTSTGAVLPVPSGGLPGPKDGVYAPIPVDEVIAPLTVGHSAPAEHAGQLLRVTVGSDASAASCAARDRQTRPASFRLTIGTVTVDVTNLDARSSSPQEQAVVGCPGRFYVGSAELQ